MSQRVIIEQIINEPKKLSESQKKAVLSEKKQIRIIAGAGAGKTETLTRKIVYLLMQKKIEPSSIVAFTFTEKAAQNMKSRIYERIKYLGGDEACAKLGDMYVGTIHGFCFRILQDYCNYGDYDVFDENQEMAFLFRVGWDLGLGKEGSYSKNCQLFLDTMNVVYSELIDLDDLKRHAPEFHPKFVKYERMLDEYKRLTFNRMIKLALDNLQDKQEIIEKIDYLLVDEYQDINRAQEKLIQLIGSKADLLIVGDPRQTIYQWRGSDEQCFNDFLRTYPDCETISISENRRSTTDILNLANTFCDTFGKGYYEHLIPIRSEKGIISLSSLENDEEEAIWISNQIENYIQNNNCDYSDIGILFRSVSTSAPKLIEEFRRRGIPYIIGGKVGLFRRDEAKAIAMLFLWLYDHGFWIENPYNWSNKITGDGLLIEGIRNWREVFPHHIPTNLEEKLKGWKHNFNCEQYKNFISIFYNLLVILGFKYLDPFNPLEAVIMANLGRFSTLLLDFESSNIIGGRKRNWKRDIRNFCWFINSYANSAYDEQVSDDIAGINAVQITTIHQAKGLEWPIVFIPSLIDTRFPPQSCGRERQWMIPRTMFNAGKYDGSIEDERKLFYVAITRAKDILGLSYFNRITRKVNPNLFIQEINTDEFLKCAIGINIPNYKITKIIDIEDIQTFFTGEIITYQKCPYFYRLRELWGYKPELVPLLGYGNSLHYCLRYASELIKNEEAYPISATVTSIDRNFYLPYAGKELFDLSKEAAKKILVNFVRKNEEDMKRIKEVETRLEFPIHRATITGKVDVILHDNENLEVRDYKTSDVVTTFEESSSQICLYTIGLKMLDLPITKGSIAYLDNGEIEEVLVEEEKLFNAKLLAEKHIGEILENKFEPKTGDFCVKCDFNIICKWCKTNGN